MRMDVPNRLGRLTGSIRALPGRIVLMLFVNVAMALLGILYIIGRFHRPRDRDLSGPEHTLPFPRPNRAVPLQAPQLRLGN